jgi:hypothetical protein
MTTNSVRYVDAIQPADVVVALLAEVRGRTGERFESDPVQLHPNFFEWRDSPESHGLLDAFVFDKRDYFPFSETLESIFDSLQFAGYLERTNPRGTWYQITPSLVAMYNEETRQKFRPEQLAALSTLAKKFVASIKTDPRTAK